MKLSAQLVRSIVSGILCLVSLFPLKADEPETLTTRQIADAYRHTIYLTLMPKKQGTGFLVSTDPPLVVTAAHDVSKYLGPREVWIRQDETGNESQVKAVHIHPNYKETRDDGFSPDVALLELELYKHDLGKPLPLKNPDGCRDLRQCEVVVAGFPFFSAQTTGEKLSPAAVIREGIISRLCDYSFSSTDLPVEERPMMQLAIETFDGDSGDPVIDRSGEVVGVVNGQRVLTFREKETQAIVERQHLPVAIHVREVWKLLEVAYPEVATKLKRQ